VQQLRPSVPLSRPPTRSPRAGRSNLSQRLLAALPLWLGGVGLAVLIGAMVAWNGRLAAIAVVAGLVLSTVVALRFQLPRLALSFLGICLLGYALMGRGFAYLGVAPLFVGEMALGLCVAALLLYLLLLNMAVGLSATLPFVGRYGIDAVRDAVLWAYGLFALCVAVLLVQNSWVMSAVRQYARFVPLFLCLSPILLLAGRLIGSTGITLPGSNINLLNIKGGDVAVMLAMIASLLLLGLHRLPELGAAGRALGQKREWIWWLLWIATASLSIFRVRAGLLAIGAALLVLLLGRAASRWQKPLLALVAAISILAVFNVQIKLGDQRNTISVQSLLVNLQSITNDTGDIGRDGSRSWRLLWWNDIVNYTVNGPYFWNGKGYGLNLATADGFQVNDDASLRSPHSAHLDILARSGVPGFITWATLQLTFGSMLILAYVRARSKGQELWARLNLWVLASWAAFMVNAAFDVYLEGPQGGIWFWSFFGFGIALLEVQRRGLQSEHLEDGPEWLQTALHKSETTSRPSGALR
jgi:O-Antigen ligase